MGCGESIMSGVLPKSSRLPRWPYPVFECDFKLDVDYTSLTLRVDKLRFNDSCPGLFISCISLFASRVVHVEEIMAWRCTCLFFASSCASNTIMKRRFLLSGFVMAGKAHIQAIRKTAAVSEPTGNDRSLQIITLFFNKTLIQYLACGTEQMPMPVPRLGLGG